LGSEHRAAGKAGADGGESAQAAQHTSFDDGADCGIGCSAPGGAEAVGDFAEDHRRTQAPFGDIIGGRHIAAGNEDEQLVPAFFDAAPELEAGLGIGLDCQKPDEAALQIPLAGQERAVRQVCLAPSDGKGALQQELEAWREPLVSASMA